MVRAKGKAKHSTAHSSGTSFVVPKSEGLQLHLNHNLFQLVSLLIVASTGATIGWCVTDDRPDIALLVGGVLGAIVGTFLSGIYLMLMPSPTIRITAQEVGRKHRELKRRLIVTSVVFAFFSLGIPLVISSFGHDDSVFAWVVCLVWLVLTVGLCVYTKCLAFRMRGFKKNAQLAAGRLANQCPNVPVVDCHLPKQGDGKVDLQNLVDN
ncbi:MAG: hypothetical protein KDB03_16300 [Planctomycetales bacterium]|nr:hypothetical protein [Planctomycetales bacterium]